MKYRHINPERIKIPPTRVTAQMDEETATQFAESVKTVGIDEPIHVYEVDGELWLSDGLHRLQQALALKLPLVDVTVRQGTMVDVLCNNLMSGHLRGKHPLSGMVKVIEELWQTHQLGPDDIVKRTGLSRDHIEGIILISQLTPMVRLAVDEGILNYSQALALTRIKDPVGQETVYGQWTLTRWSARELNGFITDVLAIQSAPPTPPTNTPPPAPIEFHCFYCGRSTDPSKLKSPLTCLECAGILLGAVSQAKMEAQQAAAVKIE